MKTKIKRHSRSALSILLTVCMLISCMTVGLIATDAAKVTDSGTVGATVDDDSVGANMGDNHEFGFAKLYVDASACEHFDTNGYAYSFTANDTGWGTWTNQTATDEGNGVYSYTVSNLWTRCFRLVTKTGSGLPTAVGVLMTPPNNNDYNYLAELENLKGIYLYAADANKDGEVDISDATTIQLSVAECPVPYPVGEVITE